MFPKRGEVLMALVVLHQEIIVAHFFEDSADDGCQKCLHSFVNLFELVTNQLLNLLAKVTSKMTTIASVDFVVLVYQLLQYQWDLRIAIGADDFDTIKKTIRVGLNPLVQGFRLHRIRRSFVISWVRSHLHASSLGDSLLGKSRYVDNLLAIHIED